MIIAISGGPSTSSASATTAVSRTPSTSEPSAHAGTDTVTISAAALTASKSAIQEATETPDQTAKEARTGDLQAQRLLAREAAEKAAQR